MIPPVLDVPCFEELINEMQEPLVGHPFAKDSQHGLVIDMIEEAFDVSFYPPSDPGRLFDFCKGRVRAPVWSEAM